MTLLLAPVGFLIGLSMGLVGGGGSLIAVPALVYLAEQSPREAQGTALLVVSVAALAAFVGFARSGQVRWRAGILFGLAAGGGALAGSILNAQLDPDLLLLAFVPVMLAGAWAMVTKRAGRPARFVPWRFGVRPGEVIKVAVLGVLTGTVIGLFGIGGGFLIVPALVLALRFSVREAVGTSLLIVLISAQFALADRAASGDVDLSLGLPFAAAALAGVLLARRWSERAESGQLRRAFALLVVALAAYTAVRSATAL